MEKAQGSQDSCKSCKHKRANSVGMCKLDRGEEVDLYICAPEMRYLPTNER